MPPLRIALAALALLAAVGAGHLFMRSASLSLAKQSGTKRMVVLPGTQREEPPAQTEPAQLGAGGDPGRALARPEELEGSHQR